MRVVIVGGGTAGHMAVAHLSRHWPHAELVHLFDSERPTIGVGEGTTPDFVQWLSTVGISQHDLVDHCQATSKRGLRFEDWGPTGQNFEHEFLPRSQQAVHFSAARLPELLRQVSTFERVDDSLASLRHEDDHTVVVTTRQQRIEADLVIDARGFPDDPDIETHRFDWITTNSALVTKSLTVHDSTVTQAFARPLGWIFRIPLRSETSYGYVYNSQTSTESETAEDFNAFLKHEGVADYNPFRRLSFPNFARRHIFDGRVFHIGNSASFMEPLEATAIGVITLQLQLLTHWRDVMGQGMPAPLACERINRIHEDTLVKVSIFIAWHYAAGSRFDTPFWNNAREQFLRLHHQPPLKKILADFETMLERADGISTSVLNDLSTPDEIARLNLGDAKQHNFGGYSVLSFAQIAKGLGIRTASSDSDRPSVAAAFRDAV